MDASKTNYNSITLNSRPSVAYTQVNNKFECTRTCKFPNGVKKKKTSKNKRQKVKTNFFYVVILKTARSSTAMNLKGERRRRHRGER